MIDLTVQTLKTSVDAKMPNTLVIQDYVDFVNDLEASVYSDTIKEFQSVFIPLVANRHQYSFPTGSTILDIESVLLNGTELPKRDLRQKNTRGYYKEQDKLALYPCPSHSDTNYVSGAGDITFDTDFITTMGDDFTGFAVGDILLVSGATTAANNRYAAVAKVEAKKLTFADGTFTEEADAAVVTISKPSLEVVCRVKPTAKTAAGISTETLLLPDAYVNIYRYYIFAQICMLREQYDKANVWMEYYNSRMVEFKIWYENNRPKQHNAYRRRW